MKIFKDIVPLLFLALLLILALSPFTGCVTVTVKPDLNKAVPTAGMQIVVPKAVGADSQTEWCRDNQEKSPGFVTFFACDDAARATMIRVSTVCKALNADTLLDYHAKTLAGIVGERDEPKLYTDTTRPYVSTDFATTYGDVQVRGTVAALKHNNCAQDILLVSRSEVKDVRQLFARYMHAAAENTSGSGKQSEIAGNE